MKATIAILLTASLVWYFFVYEESVELGPGVLAPNAPVQLKMSSPEKFLFKGYTLTPLAEFSVRAKVLSRENYRLGREADLSPVDLALGWGRMSDESVLSEIKISQSGRWYRWRVDRFPIPRKEIETHSGNMHLIPANERVETQIDESRKGNIVSFRGKLVRVDAKDGWRWISSLSRNDTGANSCELVWVEDFKVEN